MDYANALFYPKAVAVCGSAAAGKLGAVLAKRLRDGGFSGVYCVNPKGQGIDGVAGYQSPGDIPGGVDMALICSPATTVADTLRAAGRAGAKAAVIISSGFSEAGNPALEEEVRCAAGEYGIRYIGPNCAGLINTAASLTASLEASPLPGRVSLISQSGAVGGVFMEKSRAVGGLGIGKFLSFGNGTDLNGTELLRLLADDADTDVIAMYIENVKDGRAFMDALAYALTHKPVLIVKSGRTQSGQRAALSHTGAMAGADAVYDAAMTKCGAIRCESVEELLLLSKAFSTLERPASNKIAVITNSGGPGVLTADRLAKLKLDPAAPGEDVKRALSAFLPAHAGLSNPIDVTVEGDAAQYGESLSVLLQAYDAAIVIYVGTPYLNAAPIARALVQARKGACGKPVAAYFEVGADIEEAKAILNAGGIPCFASGEEAAEALAGRSKYNGRSGLLQATELPKRLERAALLEPDCMELLQEAGISTPPWRLAKSAEEAVLFADALGYPVCLKVVSRDIIHKSDVGGVKLNIAHADGVRAAFGALESVASGKDFSGVILYPMLEKGVEVILGLSRDPQFGPVAAFGMGGIFTELLKDVTLRIAPLDYGEAMDMIRSVKAYGLLTGARGARPCDVGALADMLVKLSRLMFRYPDIQEVDLNPVFAYPEGALAADARILLSS